MKMVGRHLDKYTLSKRQLIQSFTLSKNKKIKKNKIICQPNYTHFYFDMKKTRNRPFRDDNGLRL